MMQKDSPFQPLSIDELKKLTDTLEEVFQLIVVTLVYGDVLIGCLAERRTWLGQTIAVRFNTKEGKRSGHSHVVQIAFDLIADIQPIPLSEQSIPKLAEDDSLLVFIRELGVEGEKFSRLPVYDYPNPLASIISEHNLQIAGKYNLPILGFIEKALSEEAIPSEGIKLNQDFLLYVDMEFFSQQLAGDTSISVAIPGILNISKNLKPSSQTEIIRRLRNTWKDKSLRKGETSSVIKDYWVQGCIFVPESPENTTIQGEEHISVFCVNSDGETHPVLLKTKCLRYPLEFLKHITSSLSFYGELAPIPQKVLGDAYKNTLLARAIGYFHKPGAE